jgi:ABC-type Fe3+-citrate transport system substrate-binding protein
MKIMSDDEEEKIIPRWANIKQYLEANDYNLDEEDWGEVKAVIKSLDVMERNKMNHDIQKQMNEPQCIARLIEKQKEAVKFLDGMTPELMERQKELQRKTNLPLYLGYQESSDLE